MTHERYVPMRMRGFFYLNYAELDEEREHRGTEIYSQLGIACEPCDPTGLEELFGPLGNTESLRSRWLLACASAGCVTVEDYERMGIPDPGGDPVEFVR